MTLVLAAMAASTIAGLALHRRSPALAQRTATLSLTALLWVLAPFVILFSLPHLHVDGTLGISLGLGFVVAAMTAAAAWWLGSRVLRLSRSCTGSLMLAAIMMNTGYFGLPFVSALLGHHGLTQAVAFDSLVSGPLFYVFGFGIGAAFGPAPDVARAARLRQLVLRNPPLIAAIAGLLAPATMPLQEVAHDAVWGLLVLGFLALGVTLASEARPQLDVQIATAVGLRVALAPALYLGVTALAGGAPAAFRVEEAMPVGINTLVVAHASGLDLRVASSAIAWSTIVVAVWGLVASLT